MKIVLMDTGRGNHVEVVQTWREKLGLRPEDTISLLSWQPPREPLPVLHHLVFGPVIQLRTAEPRHSRTLFDLPEMPADIDASDMPGAQIADDRAEPDAGDAADPGAAEASLGEADLAGQLSEQQVDHDLGLEDAVAGPGDDTTADAEVGPSSAELLGDETFLGDEAFDDEIAERRRSNTTAHLPLTDPKRVRQAVKWRANRARLRGRRVYRGARRRLRASDQRAARVARRLLGVGNSQIANSFALALSRSREAAGLFSGADVVVPMDARSQRGAWVLARRHEGPDVVVGFPAAVRAIERRRGTA